MSVTDIPKPASIPALEIALAELVQLAVDYNLVCCDSKIPFVENGKLNIDSWQVISNYNTNLDVTQVNDLYSLLCYSSCSENDFPTEELHEKLLTEVCDGDLSVEHCNALEYCTSNLTIGQNIILLECLLYVGAVSQAIRDAKNPRIIEFVVWIDKTTHLVKTIKELFC